jgi:hypothetical protein
LIGNKSEIKFVTSKTANQGKGKRAKGKKPAWLNSINFPPFRLFPFHFSKKLTNKTFQIYLFNTKILRPRGVRALFPQVIEAQTVSGRGNFISMMSVKKTPAGRRAII